MITKFEKNMYQNMLIIEDVPQCSGRFFEEMLLNNTIEGLLSFSVRYIDDEKKYYYIVTGKQSVRDAYAKTAPDKRELASLLKQILQYIKNMNQYLLEENDIILEPDFIFKQSDPFQIQLCCCPGYGKDIVEQFAKLLEYFMNHIEYSDQDAVMLVYSFYMKSKDKSYNIDNLYQALFCEEKKPFLEKSEMSIIEEEESINIQSEQKGLKEKYSRQIMSLYDSIRSYLISVGAFVVLLFVFLLISQTGFLNKKFGNGLDLGKTFFLIIIFLVIHAGVLYIAFHKNSTYYKTKEKVIDLQSEPVNDKCYNAEAENVIKPYDIAVQMDVQSQQEIKLLPLDADNYSEIILEEFPYYIGGLKHNTKNRMLPTTSKIHAKITKDRQEYMLYDLNSTKGIYVNKNRIPENGYTMIQDGDRILIADVEYIFVQKRYGYET